MRAELVFSTHPSRWRRSEAVIHEGSPSTNSVEKLCAFVVDDVSRGVSPLPACEIFLVVLAGIFPGFLSYQAYTLMVRELGASKAGVVMYLSPIYAAFTAWWFLNEAPQWFHALGASLICK